MLNIPSILGLLAGLSSIVLWFIFSFWNPESNVMEAAPVTIMFFMLFLPACLAIFASFTTKKRFMLIAFLWSLPFSLYTAMTPSIFALFGVTSLLYLVSFMLFFLKPRRRLVKQ